MILSNKTPSVVSNRTRRPNSVSGIVPAAALAASWQRSSPICSRIQKDRLPYVLERFAMNPMSLNRVWQNEKQGAWWSSKAGEKAPALLLEDTWGRRGRGVSRRDHYPA